MIQALRDAIMTVLLVGGPVILLAAGIGLSVGIVQTVTNIQDQTTPAALKIAGVSLFLILGGTWMFGTIGGFTVKTIEAAFIKPGRDRTPVGLDPEYVNYVGTPGPPTELVQTFSKPLVTDKGIVPGKNLEEIIGNTFNTFKDVLRTPPLPKNNMKILPDAPEQRTLPVIPSLPHQSMNNNSVDVSAIEPKEILNVQPILPTTSQPQSQHTADKLAPPKVNWY